MLELHSSQDPCTEFDACHTDNADLNIDASLGQGGGGDVGPFDGGVDGGGDRESSFCP